MYFAYRYDNVGNILGISNNSLTPKGSRASARMWAARRIRFNQLLLRRNTAFRIDRTVHIQESGHRVV
jgi:hypothetical protein